MSEMVEVRVSRLVMVEDNEQQFVQLREAHPQADPREITMVIRRTEAEAISYGLEGTKLQRPWTFDLAFHILDALSGRLTQVVIHDLRSSTYYAELHVEHQGSTLTIDCRPSDAIALSLRGAAPIYVTENVFRAAQGPES